MERGRCSARELTDFTGDDVPALLPDGVELVGAYTHQGPASRRRGTRPSPPRCSKGAERQLWKSCILAARDPLGSG